MTRRVLAATALLLLAGGAVVLWFADRDPEALTTFGGQRHGWPVDVPSDWSSQVFSDDRWCEFLGFRDTFIATDGAFEFHGPRPGDPEECLGRFILAGFPRDEVAFAVQPFGHTIGLVRPACLTPPIALEDLENGAANGGPVKVRFVLACPQGDDPYPTHVVRAWIGRDAPSASKKLLDQVLTSFQFLRGPSDEF